MSSIDSLISATTYTHNLTLVTRNEMDFIPSNIPIINPWKLQGNNAPDPRYSKG